mgnify:CR=1 FL=1
MSLPLISVVLITYNGERHLREQLNSILNQTYKNVEIIIADDCSSDNTPSILAEYQSKTNITLKHNEKNLGFKENFTQACQLAKGDLIAPADQDDIWLPEKLETLQQAIGDHMLTYSNSRMMSENGKPLDTDLAQHHQIRFVDGCCSRAFYLGNCIAAHTVLFRREILKHFTPIPENLFHDQWLGFIAATMGTIKFVDQMLVHYRQNPNSVTGKPNAPAHHSLRQRIQEKHSRQTKHINNKTSYLQRMLDLQIELGRKDELLADLIQQYQAHDKHIFNWKLYQLLIKNGDLLFSTYQKEAKRLATKEATGSWFYKIIS